MAHVQIAPDYWGIAWVSTLKKEYVPTLKAPSFVSWAEAGARSSLMVLSCCDYSVCTGSWQGHLDAFEALPLSAPDSDPLSYLSYHLSKIGDSLPLILIPAWQKGVVMEKRFVGEIIG